MPPCPALHAPRSARFAPFGWPAARGRRGRSPTVPSASLLAMSGRPRRRAYSRRTWQSVQPSVGGVSVAPTNRPPTADRSVSPAAPTAARAVRPTRPTRPTRPARPVRPVPRAPPRLGDGEPVGHRPAALDVVVAPGASTGSPRKPRTSQRRSTVARCQTGGAGVQADSTREGWDALRTAEQRLPRGLDRARRAVFHPSSPSRSRAGSRSSPNPRSSGGRSSRRKPNAWA